MPVAPKINADLAIVYVDPRSVVPADYNPRVITAEQKANLRAIIEQHGLVLPFVARKEDGLLIGGHQRLDVVMALGYTEVPVIFREGLSDAEAMSLNLALNNEQAQGRFDDTRLASLLETIRAKRAPLEGTGFPKDWLKGVLKPVVLPSLNLPDDVLPDRSITPGGGLGGDDDFDPDTDSDGRQYEGDGADDEDAAFSPPGERAPNVKLEARIPLAVILTNMQGRGWTRLKARVGYADDTRAFLAYIAEKEGVPLDQVTE